PMLRWLLLVLAVPARGGAAEPPGLSCFRPCRARHFHCSWPPHGPSGSTTYVLMLCYATRRPCQRFDVGAVTQYTLQHQSVYVLTNATAWVEARWGQHLQCSPNLTLHLDKAVKPDPPPDGMPFAKAGGRLQLRVPRPWCLRGEQLLRREARFRRTGDGGWTQVMCETGKSKDGEDDPVTCELGGSAAFEVQIRQKSQHWSSHWSDWSKSVFVPKEILERPVLSFQLGNLGENGQRLLQLRWQRAREEQGDVTYTLLTRMPACRCAEEDDVVLDPEATAHNLTLCGAEYEILLTASNAAGPGPSQRLRVPAEQHAELGFRNISLAGGTVTVQWEAPRRGFAYCFERQPVPGEPQEGVCVQEDFPAHSTHVERGRPLGAPACYRLAVHGQGAEQDWATFTLQHHFAGNTSLAASVHINASAEAAVLRWEPSPRAACPGALAGYVVCHAADGDNVTHDEVEASASHYMLQNLRPSTAYRVGIQEVTAGTRGTCSTRWHFQTTAPGPRSAVWKSKLKYLGISLGLPATAVIYWLSKKRVHELLFPPLPKPMGSKAIEFSASEMSQDTPWKGFVEPSEMFSPGKVLVTELSPEKEVADSTRPCTPQPSPEELPEPGPPSCEAELPFEYRRQEVLGPALSPLPAESGGLPTCSTSSSGPPPVAEGMGSWGLPQALVPLALLISDKPIIVRDEEGLELLQKSVP
ncbi:I12R1 protein, partial [Alectura lathami]|nr:I12R1 protein [Alectura lathami]